MPLQIIRQDITKMRVDAIVNSTNSEMIGYSGLDLAIHSKAGTDLDCECARLPQLMLGKAQITKGYKLPCKYVIHTAGPIWNGGNDGEEDVLRSCYVKSLELAKTHKCKTVAFPLISSGVYGFPKDKVLKFAINTISEFLFDNEMTVYLCVFDRESYSFSQKLFNDIKSFIDDDYVIKSYEFYSDDVVILDDDDLYDCDYRETIQKSNSLNTKLYEEANNLNSKSLKDYISQMDKSFQEMLFDLIDQSGMSDVECYKKANVDKRTFSKIKSNKNYRPSKNTVIAFAISLKLDIEQTQALLATVGFTLSQSFVFDKIIRYFIYNENYNIFEINEALFEFDQQLLGAF